MAEWVAARESGTDVPPLLVQSGDQELFCAPVTWMGGGSLISCEEFSFKAETKMISPCPLEHSIKISLFEAFGETRQPLFSL